jgi:hypothetical protein
MLTTPTMPGRIKVKRDSLFLGSQERTQVAVGQEALGVELFAVEPDGYGYGLSVVLQGSPRESMYELGHW